MRVKRFPERLVCKAYRLAYHPTLGSREVEKKKKTLDDVLARVDGAAVGAELRGGVLIHQYLVWGWGFMGCGLEVWG